MAARKTLQQQRRSRAPGGTQGMSVCRDRRVCVCASENEAPFTSYVSKHDETPRDRTDVTCSFPEWHPLLRCPSTGSSCSFIKSLTSRWSRTEHFRWEPTFKHIPKRRTLTEMAFLLLLLFPQLSFNFFFIVFT